MKRFWIIFVVVIAVLGGLFFLTNKKDDTPATDLMAIKDNDHVVKADDEKVIFIEYGDFQCPGCGSAYPVIKDLKETHKDQVTFVFRHLPLTSMHANAMAAARAAEAAAIQGKFFEMHDLLFENQNSWASLDIKSAQATFEGYATQLELDLEKYKSDYVSSEVANRISEDVDAAGRLKITATPGLIVNGVILDGPKQGETFEDVIVAPINQAIKEAGGTPPAETANS